MRNNIAEIRRRAGISQSELAARVGTTLSMIGKLERGERTVSLPWLDKLARALNADPSELIAAQGGRATISEMPAIRDVAADDDAIYIRQVDLSYSMGPGSEIEDYPDEGLMRFDPALLRSITRSPPDRLFVARGVGDSMFPTLFNEDMVLIDTAQRTLNMQDRVWALSLHGAGGIKRLRTLSRTRVLLISDNPDVPDQEADTADLFIAGRVVWIARRI